MKNKTLSVCYIVKNEENVIARSIKSISAIADEIIVVDTGSSDKTIEIVKEYTNKVFPFEWSDDFSEARNFAITKATKEWILFLDADEFLNQESAANLNSQLQNSKSKWEAILFNGYNITEGDAPQIINSFTAIRCFKNKKDIRYAGRIHESIRKNGSLEILDCTKKINFYHTGYTEEVMNAKNKHDRNLTLLFRELESDPDNGNIHYYIGQQYFSMKNFEKAQIFSRQAIDNGINLYDKEKVAYVTFIKSCLKLKNVSLDEVLEICREGLNKFSEFSDLHLLHSECLLEASNTDGAVESLESYLKSLKEDEISFANANFNENTLVNIHRTLGQLYLKKNNLSNSVLHFVKGLKISKDDTVSLKNLLNILHQNHSKEEVQNFLGNLYNFSDLHELFIIAKAYAELGANDEVDQYKSMMIDIRSVGGTVK